MSIMTHNVYIPLIEPFIVLSEIKQVTELTLYVFRSLPLRPLYVSSSLVNPLIVRRTSHNERLPFKGINI